MALIVALILFCGPWLMAADQVAASCSQSDVQTAVNAAGTGNTITIPAGDCTWTSPVTVGNGKSLIGAGKDLTIVRDGLSSHAWNNAPIWVNAGATNFRISGIGFVSATGATYGAVELYGGSATFRIDHCSFTNLTVRGIRLDSDMHGLIDHNFFQIKPGATVQGITIIGTGDTPWTVAQDLGSANAVYVEDNVFYYDALSDGALDASHGAKYVFRHNQVRNTNMGNHGRDSGQHRSSHSFEVYNNNLTTAVTMFTAFNFRGGSGVLFNNTVVGNYTDFMLVSNYRSCQAYDPAGLCDGNSSYDGNTPGGEGYPCEDQIGWTTGSGSPKPQQLSPLYAWANTKNGADPGSNTIKVNANIAGGPCDRHTTLHVLANREFYSGNALIKPGYTPYVYPHPVTGTVYAQRPKVRRIGGGQ